MRKIKIRTPKSLKLPKGLPVIFVPDLATYCIKQIAAQEEEQRKQFWQDVWEGLRYYAEAADD